MRKFVTVDENGVIVSSCETLAVSDAPAAVADRTRRGLIEVDASVNLKDAMFRVLDRDTKRPGSKRPEPSPRVIPLGVFLHRWTREEKLAIEAQCDAQTPEGRAVRVDWRDLVSLSEVALDAPTVVTAITEIGAVLVATGTWKDGAAAAQRITEIRA
jgi:hypothetical protein